MTKVELGTLVEDIIRIRDKYNLTMDDRDALAEAANTLYHNIELLVEKGE